MSFKNFLLCLFTVVSCSHIQKPTLNEINSADHQDSDPQETVVISETEEKQHDFNAYSNDRVNKWIEYFVSRDKDRFTRYLTRGLKYKEVIQTMLEEDQLPSILYYLPLIESGFALHAHSHASAVGPWQFIRGTSKRYSLKTNSYIDERKDPIRSTEAATKYLKDLYNVFHSWELAIAAYNCGEIRVLRAIMRGKSRDFWELADKKLLPNETINYVPKFLAAAIVGEDFEKYNLSVPSIETFPDVESVEVSGGVHLSQIAKKLEITLDELKEVNPGLKNNYTDGSTKLTDIWIPSNLVARANQIKNTFVRSVDYKNIKSIDDSPSIHKVKRGENLNLIAQKYKMSISKIIHINNLRSSRIYPGQNLALRTRHYKKVEGSKFYFVRKGDGLIAIANKFGISLNDLKKINNISGQRIYIGQKLSIQNNSQKNVLEYRVRRGDNLHRIADRYNVTVSSLIEKNGLRNSKIFVGQIIKI
ncbi:MAG: LysM peptidoglycan-binding domain-containing protein [Halobacteriovoraceae bacterium]|nr:LysM peptidoglycan-binding domain-containing protein [Halobacteriovoraceae bacterium]